MEQQHVYHHHYHYHYIYPFPPGLPPNAPPNNEPLNQEAADRENDESSVEEEEEEHSESGDTEDQQTPENRSPSPVQEDAEFIESPGVEPERAGGVVFDSSFACLDLDRLSLEAQARFTNTESNNDDHQEGLPRNEARTNTHPDQPMPQRASIDTPSQPLQSGHLTVIDKARIVDNGDSFRVVNCDSSGPQIDICWRVPGPRNIWLARLGYARGSEKKLSTLSKAQALPDQTFSTSLEAPLDEEKAFSLIECSFSIDIYNDFEDGGGQVVPGDPLSFEFLSALGKMVGFEVVQG